MFKTNNSKSEANLSSRHKKTCFFPMRHAFVVTFDNGLRALQNRDFVDMKKERGEKTILLSSYSLLLIFSPCIDCI